LFTKERKERMEEVSQSKKTYLKKINPAYLRYTRKQLMEELYRALKSNEELTWFIKRLKGEEQSV
tara:strand:- start:353 stop:547 length:195 start_codon:yes stop_codon:yes gene_type:complete